MPSGQQSTFGRILMFSAVTGMRTALGPALIAAAQRREGREALALTAMAEMVVDKLPIAPSRASVMGLVPRALAGYWVASKIAEEDGLRDPWAAPAGAAVAACTGLVAPLLRRGIGRAFRVPDLFLGAIEDGLALYLGAQAAGLAPQDIQALAQEALGEVREGRVGPAFSQLSPMLSRR